VTCWAIIPVKGLDKGKTRLSGVLDEPERQRLVMAMLDHVVDAATAAIRIDRVCVVGPSRLGLDVRVGLLDDPGGGLDAGLAAALAQAAEAGVDRVVILAGDLPRLTPREVAMLAALPDAAMGIAPDRHGTGTNALSLPLPAARGFAFGYGPGSAARHSVEGCRLGLDIEWLHSPGLARDVDVPADLPDAGALIARCAPG
jgi:2-phospho-L-lactate guanylyltransferase